jgi:hypothetical protein
VKNLKVNDKESSRFDEQPIKSGSFLFIFLLS